MTKEKLAEMGWPIDVPFNAAWHTASNTEAGYYLAGEHTTSHNDSGFCPARTCDHRHKSREAAEKCAAKNYPWSVYFFDSNSGVTRKA